MAEKFKLDTACGVLLNRDPQKGAQIVQEPGGTWNDKDKGVRNKRKRTDLWSYPRRMQAFFISISDSNCSFVSLVSVL